MSNEFASWIGAPRKEREYDEMEWRERKAQLALARERRHRELAIEKNEPVLLQQVDYERGLGILLPIFSLPSPHGIGTLGKDAFAFLDFLHDAGVRYWQILPLNPTGYGNSPYAGLSSWAGNPNLIDLDQLATEGFLEPAELEALDQQVREAAQNHGADRIAYETVIPARAVLLRRAFQRARQKEEGDLSAFIQAHRHWLEDYALYSAIKDDQEGRAWTDWPREIKLREPQALQAWRRAHRESIEAVCWEQFKFYQQWERLKRAADEKGVLFIGDIPIYVAMDSADVWTNPGVFQLDRECVPIAVAGVPPDAYSADGQLWGNPLYRWEALKETDYSFWISRLAHSMKLYHVLRLDHFIGFSRYWRVPAGAATAKEGQYLPGPGMDFFQTAERALGPLPILVEDLGVVDESVVRLRQQTGFPGMCPITFAFGGEDSDYLPHNLKRRAVVYSSTHDAEPLKGWWDETASAHEREKMSAYFGLEGEEGVLWGILRGVSSSVADLCIFPMQDLLMLGNEARMNRPGTVGDNWCWRLRPEDGWRTLTGHIRAMALRYGRIS